MPPSDLLHDALLRATTQSKSPRSADAPSLAGLTLSDSDDDLIDVKTPAPGTPALSSLASTPSHSRSTSPTRSSSTTADNGAASPSKPAAGAGKLGRPRSGAGKPRRDKTKENAKAAQLAATMDPLAKLPGEANVRIFGELGQADLLTCGLVSKKWRSSQTINWSWYCLLESITYVAPASRTKTSSSSLPVWRRGDSKVDWAARYASINRRDDLADKGPSDEDEEGRTFKEVREEKWKEENEGREALAGDKNAMRAWYKSQGNSKIKGKTGKGAARTWEGDETFGGDGAPPDDI